MGRIGSYPAASPLTGTEKFIAVQGASSVSVTADDIKAFTDSTILSGRITKTLATSGGDFTTLDEVFEWIDKTSMSNAELVINVQAGTYQITNSPSTQTTYTVTGSQLSKLEFVGSSQANCIFNFNNTSVSKGFLTATNLYVSFNQLTFSNTGLAPFLVDATHSMVIIENIIGNEFEYLATTKSSHITVSESTINVNDVGIYCTQTTSAILDNGSIIGGAGASYGIYLIDNSFTLLKNNFTISDMGYAIFASTGSKAILETYTFTSNTQNTNIPINIIQGDGTYVTDGDLDTGDDVLEFTNLAGFPVTGDAGKIYVDKSENLIYRWSNTSYVQLAANAVTTVAGKTGDVTLDISDVSGLQTKVDSYDAHIADVDIHFLASDVTKADVGLDQVDNTADADKLVDGGYF